MKSKHGNGVYFDGGGFMPCDDDEDICENGSGDSETSVMSPVNTDSKYKWMFSSNCR